VSVVSAGPLHVRGSSGMLSATAQADRFGVTTLLSARLSKVQKAATRHIAKPGKESPSARHISPTLNPARLLNKAGLLAFRGAAHSSHVGAATRSSPTTHTEQYGTRRE
jgi:hypothetical protein